MRSCAGPTASAARRHQWIARYQEGGLANMEDRSRAPHGHPNQVGEEMEQRVIELPVAHPHWGPKKLWHLLERERPGEGHPAISTIAAILSRHGLT